jgi:hypothetical protein
VCVAAPLFFFFQMLLNLLVSRVDPVLTNHLELADQVEVQDWTIGALAIPRVKNSSRQPTCHFWKTTTS